MKIQIRPNGARRYLSMSVFEAVDERDQEGRKEYREADEAWNGDYPIIEAYPEVLDILAYLRYSRQQGAPVSRLERMAFDLAVELRSEAKRFLD